MKTKSALLAALSALALAAVLAAASGRGQDFPDEGKAPAKSSATSASGWGPDHPAAGRL
ncbi:MULTISPECIES: hypothetical protein [unclassified Streptomyces]|uniref:hypothetical protein n=1 Tax=unclassified Streptomyces TaxID=2593676 RepID=UPI00364BA78E